MGRNLVLNIADHGFSVAVYNRTAEKTRAFIANDGTEYTVQGSYSLKEFMDCLRPPRAVMLMVQAGSPVDAMIQELLPYLDPGDLLADGGNSHPADTARRNKTLQEKGVLYLGVGISGGEHGARFGPSIMPGGQKLAYERIQPILKAIAAQVNGEPCVSYLGQGAAGHYVKMVHNGIEYGLMQLIAETYDLMNRGLNLPADELHAVYSTWNKAELESYLVEITAQIFLYIDEKTGKPLVDMILDKAQQKGTGMWTSQEALALHIPVPTIDTAVTVRDLSTFKTERVAASKKLARSVEAFCGDKKDFIEQLRNALYTAMVITYAQGFSLLSESSRFYNFGLTVSDVAKIWRGGCIIRASLLQKIYTAYQKQPDLTNMLASAVIAEEVNKYQEGLRAVVQTAALLGIPAPACMVSLGYLDSYRSARLPANLIQAQRDYFGSHTYERVDAPGTCHTNWQKSRDR